MRIIDYIRNTSKFSKYLNMLISLNFLFPIIINSVISHALKYEC